MTHRYGYDVQITVTTHRSRFRRTLSASDPQKVIAAAMCIRLKIKLCGRDLYSVTARRRLNDPAGAVEAVTRHAN